MNNSSYFWAKYKRYTHMSHTNRYIYHDIYHSLLQWKAISDIDQSWCYFTQPQKPPVFSKSDQRYTCFSI